MKVCIVGASGKLGQYMVQHALDRGYEVVGRLPGAQRGQAGRVQRAHHGHSRRDERPRGDPAGGRRVRRGAHRAGALGGQHYSSGTAQAVLDYAQPGARLIFSCGWHITRDGKDVYPRYFKARGEARPLVRALTRIVDIDDQVEACRRVFASDTRWTVVRGSDLEEGESQGLPVWSRHVGDPILASNITRRVDYALFMVAALKNDALIHEAPAIVGCQTPSALAHAATQEI